MTPRAKAFLDAIAREDLISAVVDEHHGRAELRAGESLIGQVDLNRDELLVKMPADVIPNVLAVSPSAQAVPDGLRFDLADQDDALAALRRRLTVEQLAWQYRERSP